jgi:galactitol-specific phosphotransferase system IIB component
MYTWEQLVKANSIIRTTDVKGKEYAEVNQRIKAFRSICPGGSILTEMLSNENGMCVFKATICDEEMRVIGTGTAYEKETSSYINKTSYIENCETSAVGRALGMCGFGIDTSIASAEEVQNAILNQEPKQEVKQEVKQKTPRQQLIARLNELNIDVNAYAKANNLNGKTDNETFMRLLKELENA